MVMQIGFVIEGQTDDQLPECIFGCVEVNKPSADRVGKDFVAPKSQLPNKSKEINK